MVASHWNSDLIFFGRYLFKMLSEWGVEPIF